MQNGYKQRLIGRKLSRARICSGFMVGAKSHVYRLATEDFRCTKFRAAQKQVSKGPRAENDEQNATRKTTNNIGDAGEVGNADARENGGRAHAKERVQTLPVELVKLIGHDVRRNVVDGSCTPEPSTSYWDELRIT